MEIDKEALTKITTKRLMRGGIPACIGKMRTRPPDLDEEENDPEVIRDHFNRMEKLIDCAMCPQEIFYKCFSLTELRDRREEG